jgi:hypothetical protein
VPGVVHSQIEQELYDPTAEKYYDKSGIV